MKGYFRFNLIVLFIFSVIPSFSQIISNPDSLAIMPFEHPAQLESNWVDQIEASFLQEMIEKGKGQFAIVERRKIDEILREQNLQLSGLVDEATANRVGKLIGAKRMILGQILYADATRSTITISIRFVDIETGNIVSSQQVDSELYLGSIRYWIGKLADYVCGTSYEEQMVVLAPLMEVKLPEIPSADRDVTLPVAEYENLQKKINQYAQSSNYVNALRYLENLSQTVQSDSNNTS